MVSFFIQHSFVFCNRLLTHIVFIELSVSSEGTPGFNAFCFLVIKFVFCFFFFFRLWRLYFSLAVVIIIIIIKSLVLSLVPCYFCFISRSIVFVFI